VFYWLASHIAFKLAPKLFGSGVFFFMPFDHLHSFFEVISSSRGNG
jgi:hypothetical protein